VAIGSDHKKEKANANNSIKSLAAKHLSLPGVEGAGLNPRVSPRAATLPKE
jgi:hypothetical protein